MPPPTHSTRPPFATHLFSSRADRAALKAGLHRRNGIHVEGAHSMRPSVGFSCHKLNVTVGGCAAFYSAVLSAAPESPVTISPGSLPTCIRITPTVHVFTKDNWMKPQFFRVSAVTTSTFDDAASNNGGNAKVDRKFLQVIEHFSSSADPRFSVNRLLYAPASILVYVTPREGSYIFTSGRALGTAKQVGKSVVNEIHHAFVSLEHGIPVRGQPKDLVARSSMITMQSAHTTAATAAAVAAVQAANTATQAAATRRMSSKRNLFGPPASVSDVVSVSSGSTGLGSGPNTAGPLGGEMMDGMFQHLSKDAHSFTKVVCRKNQTVLLQRNGQIIALGKHDVDTSGSPLAPGSPRQRRKDGLSDPDSISDAALCNMLADVDCGDDHAMAITEQGYLLSWGNGKDGRLGHGTEDSRESPRLVKALFHKRIVHVACGARHSFVLAEDGDVFSWGDGRAGALGHGMNPESRTLDSVVAPLEVLTLKQKGVVKISCGDMHTAVVLINGSLLTCGWAEHGRLGRPCSKDDYSSYFAPVDLKGHLCTYVACGGAHTLGLTESKTIFAFGSNSSGQLGLGDCRHRSAPTLLTYFDDDHAVVTGIAAGKMHSSATTQDGRLFAWGSDEFGQCGIGSFPQLYTVPHLVASTVGLGVMQVGGGDGHSVVLCQGSHRHLDALEANHPKRYSDLMDKFELYVRDDKARRARVINSVRQKQVNHEEAVRKRKPPVDPSIVRSPQWQEKLQQAREAAAFIVEHGEPRSVMPLRPHTAGVVSSSRPTSRPGTCNGIRATPSTTKTKHIRCSSATLWRQTRLFTFPSPREVEKAEQTEEVGQAQLHPLKLTTQTRKTLGRILNDDVEDGNMGLQTTENTVVIAQVAPFAATRPKSAPSRASQARSA